MCMAQKYKTREIQPKMDPELAALIGDISNSITNPNITCSDVVDIGKFLYQKGYRKANEVRKETTKEIFGKLIKITKENFDGYLPLGVLKAWAIEYEVETEEYEEWIMKERLTEKSENGYKKRCDTGTCDRDGGCGSCYYDQDIVNRLAVYEDLEEQGLLVRLPCKVDQDKDGFFYYVEPLDEIDKKLGLTKKKIYLAFVQTVCDDFKETYCYGEDTKEFYDRHFTNADDTIEIKLIKAEKKFKGPKGVSQGKIK